MKRILITGQNSYIGTSLEKWLIREPDKYTIDTIDMKDGTWREKGFSSYDVVFHVAGIAHVTSSKKDDGIYYKVNRDLAIETAEKAKADGVRQFIFMSSIIVYNGNNKIVKIGKDTIPLPKNAYGKSKLQAEEGIRCLHSEGFKVVVLRPPMIYGRGSKGNYSNLSKFARHTLIFPDFDNQRSMLHIDNFCQFSKYMIDFNESGLFFPQNSDYVSTSNLVKTIAEVNGKRILMTKLFNPLLDLILDNGLINKVFGSFFYEKSISEYEKANYRVRDFNESVKLTELENI